jgi:hypothetical protein
MKSTTAATMTLCGLLLAAGCGTKQEYPDPSKDNQFLSHVERGYENIQNLDIQSWRNPLVYKKHKDVAESQLFSDALSALVNAEHGRQYWVDARDHVVENEAYLSPDTSYDEKRGPDKEVIEGTFDFLKRYVIGLDRNDLAQAQEHFSNAFSYLSEDQQKYVSAILSNRLPKVGPDVERVSTARSLLHPVSAVIDGDSIRKCRYVFFGEVLQQSNADM